MFFELRSITIQALFHVGQILNCVLPETHKGLIQPLMGFWFNLTAFKWPVYALV